MLPRHKRIFMLTNRKKCKQNICRKILKYLSEVSKRVSGYAVNYWINRYTSLDIARLLKDKTLTFVQISDMFHFSSPAYFSRYVQRTLGMNPTRYRE